MAVPYGNSTYGSQDVVSAKQLVRPAPLAEQLQSLFADLNMAHGALDELEDHPSLAQGGPDVPMLGGVFDTAQLACDSAMRLRQRVQELAARLGRL